MSHRLLKFGILIAFILINSCGLLQHSDDQTYSLCKNIGSRIQFAGNTSYTRNAEGADSERIRLQNTYEKLDCAKYQWLKF